MNFPTVRTAVSGLTQRTTNCEVVGMIMGVLIGLTVLIGSLLMYTSFMFGEMRGYDKGMDEAEQIAREHYEERLHKHGNRT